MIQPKLTLVGAGPGDPELITIKGVKALSQANVVLYDALVSEELLKYAKDAELIFVGKRMGQPSISQSEINQIIVKKAFSSGHVVRLKGGDPFVFARGMEEIANAQRFGITTATVIGISSILLPGMYNIPLTMRGVNQGFTVITATDAEGNISPETHTAAQSDNTTVILMGIKKLKDIISLYKKYGQGGKPIAIICSGTIPSKQQVFTGEVNTILDTIGESLLCTPGIIILGEGAKYGIKDSSTQSTVSMMQ